MAQQEKPEQQRKIQHQPAPEQPDDERDAFVERGTQEGYSYLGPHGLDQDEIADAAADGYGDQDQFGDLDNQDPYSNLYEDDPDKTPAGEVVDDPEEELYGLEEPLARPGDVSRKGSDRDQYGTRGSQDQHGYQK